jgi:hypothetical protein
MHLTAALIPSLCFMSEKNANFTIWTNNILLLWLLA